MKYNVNFDIELFKNPHKGLYIALEGIDGSGKTTQVEKLAEYFEKQGRKVFKTHEPRRDGVMGGIVDGILQGEIDLPPVALQYLFAAQRAVHLEEKIIPELKSGNVVISDRCFWSSIPYGLLDRFETSHDENGDRLLAALSVLSMYHEFIAPDYTVYLDVTAKIAGERLTHKEKAEIYEKAEKLEKIHNGYEFLFEKFEGVFTRINGDQDMEKVMQDIIQNLPEKSS
jgi:dTMP kinase